MSTLERVSNAFKALIYFACTLEYGQYVLIVREFIFSDADLLDRMGAMETMAIITTAYLAVLSAVVFVGISDSEPEQERLEDLRGQQEEKS